MFVVVVDGWVVVAVVDGIDVATDAVVVVAVVDNIVAVVVSVFVTDVFCVVVSFCKNADALPLLERNDWILFASKSDPSNNVSLLADVMILVEPVSKQLRSSIVRLLSSSSSVLHFNKVTSLKLMFSK